MCGLFLSIFFVSVFSDNAVNCVHTCRGEEIFIVVKRVFFLRWKEAKNNKAWIFVGLEEKIGELVQFQI